MEQAPTVERPTAQLRQQGQSLWLDYIRRSLMESGQLRRLVEEDSLRGMTSNPSIFQKAIGGTDEYDDDLKALLADDPSLTAGDLYEHLAVDDIRRAADILRPVFDETGYDGVVSLEVSPHLARDTEGTIDEARRLWAAVDRPNLMIKVPATDEGIPAIEKLISEGINVNVTLMFSLDDYEAVARAYIRGLQQAEDPRGILSVASFFISRLSRKIDAGLEEMDGEVDFDGGDVAIANAKMAYRRFQDIFHGEEFEELHAKGAFVQRPLWASTSTKNPAYSDVRYVEELIGRETVNTIPPHTLDAFRDHGAVRGQTVTEDLTRAGEILEQAEEAGFDLDAITEQLQVEGVEKFARPFDDLMNTLEEKRSVLLEERSEPVSYVLHEFEDAVNRRLDQWKEDDLVNRIWREDPTVWADKDTPEITNRLGWLNLPETMVKEAGSIVAFARDVKDAFDRVVVLGMGGSSLAPDVFSKVFGRREGYPELTVLDSTHPAAVAALEEELDLSRTLFIVASKSGTTAETLSFFRYFWDKLRRISDHPGDHFVAITDPGTPLTETARERKFRKVFRAPEDVGGRYSVFTPFGLVPAALGGVDIEELLDLAWMEEEASAFSRSAPKNSGVRLGAILGELALAGRDKLTFFTSPALAGFPAWLEQLVAESLGKEGTGIVPVADEPPAAPDAYGQDRFFVYFELAGDADETTTAAVDGLEAAGHPVARVYLERREQLGREMYRWEMGVAAAGALLGVHPFDQPNVEAAKRLARQSMEEGPSSDGMRAAVPVAGDERLESALRDWFANAEEDGYISVQAYLAPDPTTDGRLRELVRTLRDETGLATTVGYGPRFLHSTGQLHKGGPSTGLFLQIVDDPETELPVPETDFSFKELITAQAVGDYRALRESGRHVLRLKVRTAEDVSLLLESIERLA